MATLVASGLAREGPRESRNVLQAIPERGDTKRKAVEAKIEILPKAASGNEALQPTARARHEADINGARHVTAHTRHGAAFDDTKQFALGPKGQVAEVVQHEGAPIRLLQEAGRPAEGPSLSRPKSSASTWASSTEAHRSTRKGPARRGDWA